jgi:enediyne biosynthesis thioesterase
MKTEFEYRRRVGFRDTNLTGNVYFLSHMQWQGECREMFLQEHFPEVLDELKSGLALITTYCACEYLGELNAFDEVAVRMRLGLLTQTQVTLLFDYWKCGDDGEELVAKGEQRIACFRRDPAGALSPTAVPAKLKMAIAAYSYNNPNGRATL